MKSCYWLQFKTCYCSRPLRSRSSNDEKAITFADTGKESFVTYLMKNSLLTFEQAEAVFFFQMNGCLAINRMMIKNHCMDWTVIQKTIDSFIKAGLESLLKPDL